MSLRRSDNGFCPRLWRITEDHTRFIPELERMSNWNISAEQCQKLQTLCGLSPWSVQSWKASLTNDRTLVSAVIKEKKLKNGELIALCLTQLIFDEAELLQIFVNPMHQNKGFAKFLIKDQFFTLKNDHYKKIILEVNENNMAAIHAYKSLGFYQYDIRKKYYLDMHGNYSNALLMSIEL